MKTLYAILICVALALAWVTWKLWPLYLAWSVAK